MKITRVLFGAMLLALPIVLTVQAVAQEGDATTQTTNRNEEAPNNDAARQQQNQSLQTRLNERKARQTVQLIAADSQRLAARCKPAQGKVRSLEGRMQGIESSRQQVYKNIIERLVSLRERLETEGADTTLFASQIAEVEMKSTTFFTSLDEYRQALNDLGQMDCETDPEAFKATLLSARQSLVQLRQNATEIRQFLKNEISSTLVVIRQELESTKSTTDSVAPKEGE